MHYIYKDLLQLYRDSIKVGAEAVRCGASYQEAYEQVLQEISRVSPKLAADYSRFMELEGIISN